MMAMLGSMFGGKGGSWGGDFGKSGKFGKGKGKGKSKGKNPNWTGGNGHLLPRTRISEAPFGGTVLEWKGKYGWIQPAEEIPHEKAKKHQGRIFVGMDDVMGDTKELTPGATVQYHIWEDEDGLGAEEVQAI